MENSLCIRPSVDDLEFGMNCPHFGDVSDLYVCWLEHVLDSICWIDEKESSIPQSAFKSGVLCDCRVYAGLHG